MNIYTHIQTIKQCLSVCVCVWSIIISCNNNNNCYDIDDDDVMIEFNDCFLYYFCYSLLVVIRCSWPGRWRPINNKKIMMVKRERERERDLGREHWETIWSLIISVNIYLSLNFSKSLKDYTYMYECVITRVCKHIY